MPPPTWFTNPAAGRLRCTPAPTEVRAFHAALPGYAPTPLTELPALAAELGVGRVLVKDESARLGLPAFKILGASWAVDRILAGRPDGGRLRLVTATDGNHGRAVARTARLRGHRAHVVVPAGVHRAAVAAIVDEGAQVTELTGDYDTAVGHAAELAAEPGSVLVQDTALPGYEEIPGWIVQGYSTLFGEIDEQLGGPADLVVVPMGVGSLAQAAVAHQRALGGAAVLGVEPGTAACVLAALVAGRPVAVATGTTIMAGLNCGTVSGLAWPVLRDGLDAAVAVTDDETGAAAADLRDLGVAAGPCGAAALAGARSALVGEPDRRAALAAAGVGDGATVVLLSTDGAAANPVRVSGPS
ncbi:pyridoxal-phosphate dependent enzyme [Pseudonocardia lacus]|uniref:pyridoxal-phosphate dependent enzyme n=1 Tax=Pseudonocardia lacus TaxID=2835865 RepID=UPI0020298033|nr:pyridoxal-phosphate dependent enzyme [Pseudonocardia lacus]